MEWKRILRRKKLVSFLVGLFLLQIFLFLYFAGEDQEPLYGDAFLDQEVLQQEYVDDFHSLVEAVVSQADSMGGISIFAQQDSFANRNLEKTKQDFQKLLSVQPVLFDTEFLTSFFEDFVLNGIVVICGILVAFHLVDENKEGLRSMIFSMVKGRGTLALQKLAALFIWDVLLVLVFYGGTLVCSCIRYRGDFLNCLGYPIQSLQIFANLPWKMGIGTFFICYLCYRCMILFLIMLIVWFILYCLDHILYAMGTIAAVGILEYLFFSLIPKNHPLCLLKYCNLWYQMSGVCFFTEYRNLNFAGYAVNKNLLIGISWFLCSALFMGIGLWIGSKRYPCTSRAGNVQRFLKVFGSKLQSLSAGIPERLSLAGTEYYKALISQRGMIILFLLVVIFVYQTDFTEVQKSGIQEMYYQFLDQYEGVPGVSSERAIADLKEQLEEVEEDYQKNAGLYEQGKISKDEWLSSQIRYDMFEDYRIFLEQIENQTQYLNELKSDRGINGWYINIYPYRELLRREDSLKNVLLIFSVVLLCSGLFSAEQKCGMLSVMRGTVEGRDRIFRKKMQVAVTLTLFLFFVAMGMEIGSVIHVYGLGGLGAPVQSLEQLSFVPISCNVGMFFLTLYILKGLLLLIIAVFTCMFSARTNQKLTIVLSFSLCIPALLVLAGFDFMQYVSIIQVLSVVPFLLQVRNVGIMIIVVLFFLILGICSLRNGYREWCNT